MNLGGTIHMNRKGLLIICCVLIIFIYYLYPTRSSFNRAKVDLRQLLITSVLAAQKGGIEVLKGYNEKASKGKTKEGVEEYVTSADYDSHCVMYHGILGNFPNVKVISEEKDGMCESLPPLKVTDNPEIDVPEELINIDRISVWIDPLDATKEYTEKLTKYVTTMVCVAVDGIPIIGVIHKPFTEQTYWAWLNRKHSSSLKNISEQNEKKIIVSKSHAGKVKELIGSVFKEGIEIVEAGGSGYKSIELVTGKVGSYIHITDISKWDICAGDAIVTAMGGIFTDLAGKNIDYRHDTEYKTHGGVFASSSSFHKQNLEKVSQYFKIS